MPILSICIPTYNRSRCLAELLESIADQDSEDIEVIVSDDASPDDSVSVAESYRSAVTNLTVLAQPKNLGVDQNFLAVTSAAVGRYIWLMGDDDRLEPGGVERVLGALADWPGVAGLTLGVIDYDEQMKEPTGIRAMPPTQLLVGAEAVFSKMAELLGFMSALVIDRTSWEKVANDPSVDDFKKYYVQVYIIGRVIGATESWGVVKEPCVGFRSGNDQFFRKFGWFKRLQMDVIAYNDLGVGLFGAGTPAYKAMKRRIFNTHVMARVRNAKTVTGRTTEIPQALAFLAKYYAGLPEFWTSLCVTLLAPKWFIRDLRKAYKRFAPTSGAARARKLT